MSASALDVATARIRADYLEMPGLRLTSAQVQRLCGVEGTVCQEALDGLVEANVLWITAQGAYALVGYGEYARLQPDEEQTRPIRGTIAS